MESSPGGSRGDSYETETDLPVERNLPIALPSQARRLGLAQELQPVARLELWHPIHEVRLVVPRSDRMVLWTARLASRREKLRNLDEVVFETRLADELQQPGRLIGRVPERVRDTAGLVDVGAGPGLRHLVPYTHADATLEHIGQLVFHRVSVWRDQAPCVDRMLDDCEAATGLVAPHLEVHPQPHAELDRPAFTWTHDQQVPLLNFHATHLHQIFARHACILIVTIAPGRWFVNNQVTLEFPEIVRKYTLRRRAKRQEETRRKIVAAAVELHTTVGPAHTTDLAIAVRAGVTRRTFYRHFPDDVSLFRACTSHTMEMWPPPASSGWRRISDPAKRLAVALRELYAFYRVAGRGLVVIMRDVHLLRRELLPTPNRADLLRAMNGVLLEGWGLRGRRRDVLRAAIAHATSVTTWQSLVEQQGLTDQEAVGVLTGMVLASANTSGSPSGTLFEPPGQTRKALARTAHEAAHVGL